MESEVLQQLHDEMQNKMHPRAKRIYDSIKDLLDRRPQGLTISVFAEELKRVLSKKEADEIFCWLTDDIQKLKLMPTSASKKFQVDYKIYLSMAALNNMLKYNDVSNEFKYVSPPIDVKEQQKSIQKHVVYRYVDLSTYSTSDLKREIQKRELEIKKQQELSLKQDAYARQLQLVSKAANAIGYKNIDQLYQLIQDTYKLQQELNVLKNK